MIYNKKVIQQNVVKYGKRAQVINSLKQSENMILMVKNEKEKEEIVRRFKLSFKNGSKILFPEEQKDEGFESWTSFDASYFNLPM